MNGFGCESNSGFSVLVVDDEPDIREVLTLILRDIAGWVVHTAEDGATAVERAIDVRPDVVLLDARMPGLDGPGTVRRLQEHVRTRDVPVVLLTASPELVECELQFAAVRGVIRKPFDPFTLVEDVSELVARTGAA